VPSQNDLSAKRDFSTSIIDGSTHDILDKSFNESMFNGAVN
jgi:hypothetical protein